MHTINEIYSQFSLPLGHTMIRVVLIGYDSLVYLIINQTCLTESSCLISSYDHESHGVACDYHMRVNHGYMSVTHIVCPVCCQSRWRGGATVGRRTLGREAVSSIPVGA